MVHTFPDVMSQPLFQVTDVEVPVGVAVNVIAVPLGKFALHVEGQLMPAGLLVIVPVPPDEMPTARSGPEPPEPVMQVTFAVAVPNVTEPRDGLLGLLKTVAEISMPVPQPSCEVAKPG